MSDLSLREVATHAARSRDRTAMNQTVGVTVWNMTGAHPEEVQLRRYLIVANVTLTGPAMIDEVLAREAAGSCVFHIVVPASREHGSAVWTEGKAIAHARAALEHAIRLFGDVGVAVTGEVGDENPVLAVGDVLRVAPFDEIIVSTLPAGASRWLRRDLPRRIEREHRLPVTHVVAEPQTAAL